jgi:hypothetical protein
MVEYTGAATVLLTLGNFYEKIRASLSMCHPSDGLERDFLLFPMSSM